MSDIRDDAAAAGELTESDRALLDSAEREASESVDVDPNSLEADDAVRVDVGTQPASVTSSQALEDDGYEDTIDGLDPLEEAVRQQAEDHASGDDEDYTG
ncbi:MAG: hypothetical protein V7704_14520 [Aurantimonas endophytica]|uniref:hypothetical protein n=1 Tax=Aurantimonas endophytica TaxID=1522175 RepID=UPI003001B943